MSSSLKIQASEKNYSEYRKALSALETDDLKLLLEWCTLYKDPTFKYEIKAINEELEFRNSSLGKELL